MHGNEGGIAEQNTTYLVHMWEEPSSFPSISTFRGELKADLDDPDVVYLCTYSIHAVRRWSDENLLMSARWTQRHAWGSMTLSDPTPRKTWSGEGRPRSSAMRLLTF